MKKKKKKWQKLKKSPKPKLALDLDILKKGSSSGENGAPIGAKTSARPLNFCAELRY